MVSRRLLNLFSTQLLIIDHFASQSRITQTSRSVTQKYGKETSMSTCCRIQIHEHDTTYISNPKKIQFHRTQKQTKIPVDYISSRNLSISSIFTAQIIEMSPQKSSYATFYTFRSRFTDIGSFSARRFPLRSRPPQKPLRDCLICN